MREVGRNHIRELQQTLLKDDCYLPGFTSEDSADFARRAHISSNSEEAGGEAVNVISGVSRTVDEKSNCWVSKPLAEGDATLMLSWAETIRVGEIRLTFDSNLSREIMPSIGKIVRERQVKGLPEELVRDYTICAKKNGETVWEQTVQNNGQRLRIHALQGVECDSITVTESATHGCVNARIYEVRVYEGD